MFDKHPKKIQKKNNNKQIKMPRHQLLRVLRPAEHEYGNCKLLHHFWGNLRVDIEYEYMRVFRRQEHTHIIAKNNTVYS